MNIGVFALKNRYRASIGDAFKGKARYWAESHDLSKIMGKINYNPFTKIIKKNSWASLLKEKKEVWYLIQNFKSLDFYLFIYLGNQVQFK